MITITIQLEHHSQYVTWCVCITEYRVWYRDSSQADIDEIPELNYYKECRDLTLDELVSATRGYSVTHMSILGDIPPIDEIAPHLKQLRLFEPPDRDQSDRSVNDLLTHEYVWFTIFECANNINLILILFPDEIMYMTNSFTFCKIMFDKLAIKIVNFETSPSSFQFRSTVCIYSIYMFSYKLSMITFAVLIIFHCFTNWNCTRRHELQIFGWSRLMQNSAE